MYYGFEPLRNVERRNAERRNGGLGYGRIFPLLGGIRVGRASDAFRSRQPGRGPGSMGPGFRFVLLAIERLQHYKEQ